MNLPTNIITDEHPQRTLFAELNMLPRDFDCSLHLENGMQTLIFDLEMFSFNEHLSRTQNDADVSMTEDVGNQGLRLRMQTIQANFRAGLITLVD